MDVGKDKESNKRGWPHRLVEGELSLMHRESITSCSNYFWFAYFLF